MSRKTTESRNHPDSSENPVGIVVPSSVEVRGIGAAGMALAKALSQSAAATGAGAGAPGSSAGARLLVTDSAGLAELVKLLRTEQDSANAPDTAKTWVALLLDGLDTKAVAKFDDSLAELSPEAVELVLLVDSAQASELLPAWAAVKAGAPASVLSRLPDATGAASRYVALTGVAIVGTSAASSPIEPGADGQVAVLAGDEQRLWLGMRELVQQHADEVRQARDQVVAAVAAESASDALKASSQLDTALAQLREVGFAKADANAAAVIRAGAAEAPDAADTDADASTGTDADAGADPRQEVDLAELAAARTEKLSAFLLASSKGALGKLFAKAKLKQAGAQVVSATDAYVEGLGSQLISDLTKAAMPAALEAKDQLHSEQEGTANKDLLAKVEQQAAKLTALSQIDLTKINRPWSPGTPAPRTYLLAGNLLVDLLAESGSRTEPGSLVPVRNNDVAGAYILQAQYALSKSAISA